MGNRRNLDMTGEIVALETSRRRCRALNAWAAGASTIGPTYVLWRSQLGRARGATGANDSVVRQ